MKTSTVRAIVLAAGRGERMRPLTDTCPKPLLLARGKPLMQWALEALARGGFTHVLVNTAWLGEQIAHAFGNVFVFSARADAAGQDAVRTQLVYSHEGRDFGAALETAGGIARALPWLCPTQVETSNMDATDMLATNVFWVVAGDVFAPDFVFTHDAITRFASSGKLAHVWLVPNPSHNAQGDFGLESTTLNPLEARPATAIGLAVNVPPESTQPRYTYSGIGLYHKALFARPWCTIAAGNPLGERAALGPLLRTAIAQQKVSAELYTGAWTDVGTPQRLAQINAQSSDAVRETDNKG